MAEEFFTTDGGYVLMDGGFHTPDDEPLRFACTAGDNDQGVMLTTDECIRLGVWLLKQAVARACREPVAAIVSRTLAGGTEVERRPVAYVPPCPGYGNPHGNVDTLTCPDCEPF